MKIIVASDHAGYESKNELKKYLVEKGHEVIDAGTDGPDSVDYPDFGHEAARAVASGEAERGIIICGTGIGMCMSANKHPGIRAGQVHDEFTAEMSRRHNDANILCMGARVIDAEKMKRLAGIWLETPFDGGRHVPRVGKIEL